MSVQSKCSPCLATALYVTSLALFPVLLLNADVYAAALDAQGADLNQCIAQRGAQEPLEQRLRICRIQRDRSLLYSGNTQCPVNLGARRACQVYDAATATGSADRHTPAPNMAPITRDQIGTAYEGYTFYFKGRQFRVAANNVIQERLGYGWRYFCRVDSDTAHCLYQRGSNSVPHPRFEYVRYRVTCTDYALRFFPALSRVRAVETTSRVVADKVGAIDIYYCLTDDEVSYHSWRNPS